MKKKIIALLVLPAALATMIYSGGQLAAAAQIVQEGSAVYGDLSSKVRERHMQKGTEDAEEESAAKRIYIPESGIDFKALKEVNKDAAAWLFCPDTIIDYPVMEADDYSYYLHHLPDGKPNANGSLFIDYNCAADFSDALTVIYGHNMKSEMMFGSLVKYKNQKYYDEHPYMYLYTQQGNYRIDLLYGCVIGAGQWRERAFMYKENVGALIAYAENETTFVSDAEFNEGDRIVAMSTCSYEFENARYVVIGILRGAN